MEKYRINTELTEVKEIMERNMEELLNRGKSIDELMVKSKDLSVTTVEVYKRLKKKNEGSCWNLS